MGRGRTRFRNANTSGPQRRLADRAADNHRVEGAFNTAEQRGVRSSNRPLLRERAQALALLPATALAEYFDDVAEPLRPLEPVDLQARLNPVGIAGMDAANHLFMLRYREVQVLDDGAGIQPPIALGLRLDGFVKRRQTGSSAILDDQAVEGAIVLKNLSRRCVAIFRDHFEAVVELLQLRADILPFRRRQRGNASTGNALKPSNDEVKLVRILLGQRSHDHARLLGVAVLQNVPFAMQQVVGSE